MSVKIHPRSDWNARTPRPRSRQFARNVREMFLHWPGEEPRTWRTVSTQAEERQAMREVQNFHMDSRGWSDFAYSFAIFPSGRIYRGRGLVYVPAAQEGHNTNTVAVCCFMGPEDELTPQIANAIQALRKHLERRTGHRLTVRAHGEVTRTECPGPKLRRLANAL